MSDRMTGKAVERRREALGWERKDLGERLGLSGDARRIVVHKIEREVIPISAGMEARLELIFREEEERRRLPERAKEPSAVKLEESTPAEAG